MNKSVISCNLHDYVEIVCLYRYQVKLTLRDLQTIEGTAVDIRNNADKSEYLLVDTGHMQQIELNQLKKLQVLTPNARFTEVVF